MQEQIIRCDMCAQEIQFGFRLLNLGEMPKDYAKLDGDADFCSLICLAEWSKRALAALPKLEQHALEIRPHGRLTSPAVERLCVD